MIFPRVRILALAAAASIAAVSGAHSADLPLAPPPVPEFSGWYLRGDIGFSNQNVRSLYNVNYAGFTSVNNIDKGFDAAPLFGLGVGYTVNNWLRFDVTGEYRGAANFHGLDVGAIPVALALPHVSPMTGTPPASRNGRSCSTVMLISVPGGALRRSSGPASVRAAIRSAILAISRPALTAAIACGGRQRRLRRHRQQVEFRVGLACRYCLPGLAEHNDRACVPLYRPRQCAQRRRSRDSTAPTISTTRWNSII